MLTLSNCKSRFPLWVAARALLIVALWLPLPAALALAYMYGAFQASLPPTPQILTPPPGSATQVFALDGRPIGGLHRGVAPWARYDDLPPRLVEAFLAAEDDEFFLHHGVDLRAILRAAVVNLRSGTIRQGGSTVTQQLAKMFVGRARTYERKLIELMVARRIEAAYSKQDILEAYLNRVYLGAGADGVVAAARIYFDHSLDGLTLAEAATLAGIASAPSTFEPYEHPERAQRRRDWVLTRMAELGFITPARAESARAEPLRLRERGEAPDPLMPYVVESIRLQLLERFGRDAWQHGALAVYTAVSPVHQRLGEQALRRGLQAIDRRQGYRGPLRAGTALDRATFDRLVAQTVPADEPLRPALVEVVESDHVTIWVDSGAARIDEAGWAWAYPYDDAETDNEQVRETALGLAEPGDLVLVEAIDGGDGGGAAYRLAQLPRLEGALVSFDLDTGYLRALVGGYDFDRSQFNRATYACRQPGSTFKPVIYSLALDSGLTLVTPLVDAPIRLHQGGYDVWRPRNADGRFRGALTLREALIWSRNLPTVRVFRRMGARRVVERARELGITTQMEPTDALSLGASCVFPIDLVAAYGVFANDGYRLRPRQVVSVVDGRGTLFQDDGVFFDAMASASAVLHRAMGALRRAPRPVIDPQTAYLMRFLLTDVVRLGTAHAASQLGVPAAGKTGTTNAYDAWFAGFTEDLAAVVWVGSDRNTRPLGRGETGADVALPIWLDYMRGALDGLPQSALTEPLPPGLALYRVDRSWGLLAHDEAPGTWLPFREGTEPTEYAPTPEERDLLELDRVDRWF
jgi:penicillin-binding protein 1A